MDTLVVSGPDLSLAWIVSVAPVGEEAVFARFWPPAAAAARRMPALRETTLPTSVSAAIRKTYRVSPHETSFLKTCYVI